MSGSTDKNSEEWITTRFLVFPLTYYFVELYFIKRHVWKVKIFHKTVHKTWNHFKLSEQSPKNSAKKICFTIFGRLKVTFDQSSSLFDRLNRNWVAIETSKDSRIFFFTISIDQVKVSTNRKCCISNFHLEIPKLEFSL